MEAHGGCNTLQGSRYTQSDWGMQQVKHFTCSKKDFNNEFVEGFPVQVIGKRPTGLNVVPPVD